jgi:hypothetical protein
LTLAATRASGFDKRQFRFRRHAFGIVAPPAPQRAAFEEDRRANARPVVQRVSLDVKNRSLEHSYILQSIANRIHLFDPAIKGILRVELE